MIFVELFFRFMNLEFITLHTGSSKCRIRIIEKRRFWTEYWINERMRGVFSNYLPAGAKIKECRLVLVHLRVHMAFTAAQLCFVVVLAVNALVVLVLFTVGADHCYSITVHFVIF
jgi:hypothetical protein